VKFPYRRYEVTAAAGSPAEVATLYRPVIPFTLVGPAGGLDFFGLLNTGADETYITQAMANRLGLETNEYSTAIVESASGAISIRYGTATLEVSDGHELFRWTTIIGITEEEWAEAILGHAGFLEFFDALFRGYDSEVVLTRNESALPSADT
jgi:hypothetical protein